MNVNLLTLNGLLAPNLRVGSAAAPAEMSVTQDSSSDAVPLADGDSASERLTVRNGETLTTYNIIVFSQILAQSVGEPLSADFAAGGSMEDTPGVGPDAAQKGLNDAPLAVTFWPIQPAGILDMAADLVAQSGQTAGSPTGSLAGQMNGYPVEQGVELAPCIITQSDGSGGLAGALSKQLQLADSAQAGGKIGQSGVRAIQADQIQSDDSRVIAAGGEQASAPASVVTSANQPVPPPFNNGQYGRFDAVSTDTVGDPSSRSDIAALGNGDVSAHTLQQGGNTDLLLAHAAARPASEVPGKVNTQKQNAAAQINQQSSPGSAAGCVQSALSSQKESSFQMQLGSQGREHSNLASTDNPVQSANSGMALGQNIQTIVEQYTPVSAPPSAGRGADQNMPSDLGATLREQIQQSVRDSLQQGVHEITIRLNPPELGRVTLRFRQDGSDITAALEAGRVETRAEIQNAVPEILRNLQQAGIQIKQFDVSLADTSSGGQGSSREQLGQDAWLGGQNAPYSDGDRSDYNRWADVHSQATAAVPYEPAGVSATAVGTAGEPGTLNILM